MKAALAAALCLWAMGAAACESPPWRETAFPDSVVTDPASGGDVTRAWFADPVTRYRHFVLGRQVEPETLWVDAPGNHGNCGHALTLDAAHVFEDIAPHLADLDGDGTNEVIVVRSRAGQGAQLAIYRWTGATLELDAATPYIGRTNRWLAPLGAADLDGDGTIELAYIDRPHLARTLRIWRYDDGALTQVAAVEGLTNHRIGEPFISGGIRMCGQRPEIVTVDAGWSRVIATRLENGRIATRDIGAFRGAVSLASAIACQ